MELKGSLPQKFEACIWKNFVSFTLSNVNIKFVPLNDCVWGKENGTSTTISLSNNTFCLNIQTKLKIFNLLCYIFIFFNASH